MLQKYQVHAINYTIDLLIVKNSGYPDTKINGYITINIGNISYQIKQFYIVLIVTLLIQSVLGFIRYIYVINTKHIVNGTS